MILNHLIIAINLLSQMLLDVNGVSPFQRVYGINTSINTLNQKEISRKCSDSARNQDIQDLKIHLNTIQAFGEAFVKAGNEENFKKKPITKF